MAHSRGIPAMERDGAGREGQMATTATRMRSVQEMIDHLRAIPPTSFTGQRVLDEIGHTVLDPSSLTPYAFFSPDHYTRNLIHCCDLFEVVALGWERGQESPIHNHHGQECWMGVPVGRLEVRNFRLTEHDPERRTCRLAPSIRFAIDPARAAAVDPEEPIHSVHNLPEFERRAVSVHVYSLPFQTCEVYDLDRHCYDVVRLDYTSRLGTLCPGAVAEAAGF
jgi:cysteine dioxygenase